ncbi:MAG: hypothetical protein HLUCCA11_21395 [Phormidesmis priestleyi Ana]|uniref:Uncharacterized protein n=1 Tax=Phormidesmis priestleyi Ana TaxID=1666911 RepID=A0A0P8D8R7_9CYAN|nr:MAG: hypothetical protein HLUCCA11_21395 [Phormidesmis priestleyi Ana]
MSLSPFKSGTANQAHHAASNREPLNLFQALLITAGLAGLVGLCSGAIIRFSLSQSSEARFLSPLQTFPALPDWTSELPQGTADSQYLPDGAVTDRNSPEEAPSLPDSDIDPQYAPEEYTSEEYAPEEYTPEEYTSEEYAPEEYTSEEYAPEEYIDNGYTEEPYSEVPYAEEPYPETEAPAPEEAPYYYEDYGQP